MTYGYARLPADAVIPESAMAPIAPGDVAPKVSKVGPLMRFLPLIYDRTLTMANRMGITQNLLNGNFEALDAETTGFSRTRCVLWQLSAVRFENFEPASELNRVISISREDFDNAFTDHGDRDAMLQTVHLSWERIQKEGVPAAAVLGDFYDYLIDREGMPLLGYHTRSLDLPFIQILWAEHFPDREVFLPMHRLIDMGVAIKSAQLEVDILPDEDPDQFMRRVMAMREKQVYWSVQYAAEQFQLGLDFDALHDSLVDCKTLGMIWDFIAHQGMSEERKREWQDRLRGSN